MTNNDSQNIEHKSLDWYISGLFSYIIILYDDSKKYIHTLDDKLITS
jgi:hypothetical protein